MKKIAFFDTKPYDRTWFDILAKHYEIAYFEEKLNRHTATLTDGFDAVCAFVNDRVDAAAIDRMHRCGVQLLALRCAGFSNVDMQAAAGKLRVVRVPAYSPHAVAEHTMGLLLTLNRRLHRAYIRTRDFNFSIVGLTGIDLYKKTVGIIGTGRIGRAFAEICRGFGMRVLAYDKYPAPDFEYVSLDTLLRESDVISLHLHLNKSTEGMIGADFFRKMKKDAFFINTARGAIVKENELIAALRDGEIAGAGIDVLCSETVPADHPLIGMDNVILTPHAAWYSEEASLALLTKGAEEVVRGLNGEKLLHPFNGIYYAREVE